MSPRVQNLLSLAVLAAALMISSYPEKSQTTIQVAQANRAHGYEQEAK